MLEDKAQQIALEMEKAQVEKHIVVDVVMVMTIIKIIVHVIKIYQACEKPPAAAAASMRQGGILERWRLRKVIRAEVDDDEMHAHIGPRMLSSILHVSTQLSDLDVEKMYEEVAKH